MANATVTVRLPRALKDNAEAVFKRAHTTPTRVVREVYEYAATHDKLPDAIAGDNDAVAELRAQRRSILRQLLADARSTGHRPLTDAQRDEARYEQLMAKRAAVAQAGE
jgi:antitoxin component of RelBE/YafQ-DinJ toxin-antitoxin module